LAEEKGLHLAVEAPGGLAVTGDPDMLRQAVTNLTDNAVKFSPSGGIVRLFAAAVPAGVEIAVQDEGPGIPPEDLARATERFFRGEAARSTPGSGLGLALVQAVAHLHGGTLRLDALDPGLRATLCLPAGG
jgi:signal transduction histidine kinase